MYITLYLLPFPEGTKTLHDLCSLIQGMSAFSLGADNPVNIFLVTGSYTVIPDDADIPLADIFFNEN